MIRRGISCWKRKIYHITRSWMSSSQGLMILLRGKIISSKSFESCCRFSAHGKSTQTFLVWHQDRWWSRLSNQEGKVTSRRLDKTLWVRSDRLRTRLSLMQLKRILRMWRLPWRITSPRWRHSRFNNPLWLIRRRQWRLLSLRGCWSRRRVSWRLRMWIWPSPQNRWWSWIWEAWLRVCKIQHNCK